MTLLGRRLKRICLRPLYGDWIKHIDPKKLIVGIGSFGYDWSEKDGGREISVSDAWSLLKKSKAPLAFDPSSLNLSFSYQDEQLNPHKVWYLDAATTYNQLQDAMALNPVGIALWHLGFEDPSVWRVLANAQATAVQIAPLLTTFRSGNEVEYSGDGDILEVLAMARNGYREISLNTKNNRIVGETMRTFPLPTIIRRFGHRDDKVVALTFDDGPDPVYTPQILDILKSRKVLGSFFVVGSMGARYPELLRRLYEEGHDIGNHTFTHSADYLAIELNATQRLLESVLGIRTALFRSPYSGDTEPRSSAEANALAIAASLGYVSVGMTVDPHDWMRPLPDQIVRHVVENVTQRAGNIVLLHDAGGNRSSTAAALPRIIDELQRRGYRFETVHELVGLPRSAFMPTIAKEDLTAATMNGWSFQLFTVFWRVIAALFVAGIVLGISRSALLSLGACWHLLREKRRSPLRWQPKSVTVLIPAFNEVKVINASIRAMLKSRCSLPYEILVIDDGSTDGTADIVRAEFAANERVRVLTKPNGGKWTALNFGLQNTSAEVIVSVDADTLFDPEALNWLLRHFADPKVGAVAGTTMVGNTRNLMGAFQKLEYLTSQNLERRALEICNAVTVVPGSIGAWRREAILSVGAYNGDTLAEDADLTMLFPIRGWKVVYEPRAIALTEAPESIGPFLKQRFRWVFGTLQAAFKNGCAGASATGFFWIGLPNILVFHFVFALIAPIMDIAIIWSVIAVRDPTVLAYYGLFLAIDLAGASLAIYLDRRRGVWQLLPLVVAQRFFYRQLLSLIAIRAFVAICQGRVVGWNSVARTGSLCTDRPPLAQPAERVETFVPMRPAQNLKTVHPIMPVRSVEALNDRQRGRRAAKSVSVGVPVFAIAACAAVLMRVPEIADFARLTPMLRHDKMVVASADANSAAPVPVHHLTPARDKTISESFAQVADKPGQAPRSESDPLPNSQSAPRTLEANGPVSTSSAVARVNENNPTSPDPAAALATASRLTHGRPEVDQVELAAPLAAQVEEVKTKPAEDVVTIAAETSTQVNIVRVADAPVENVMTTDVEAQATRFIPKSNPEIDENVPATADLNRADITIPIAIAAGDLDPQAAEESRPASVAPISPELPHTSEPIAKAPLDQSVAASLAKPTERLTQVRRNAEAAAWIAAKENTSRKPAITKKRRAKSHFAEAGSPSKVTHTLAAMR